MTIAATAPHTPPDDLYPLFAPATWCPEDRLREPQRGARWIPPSGVSDGRICLSGPRGNAREQSPPALFGGNMAGDHVRCCWGIRRWGAGASLVPRRSGRVKHHKYAEYGGSGLTGAPVIAVENYRISRVNPLMIHLHRSRYLWITAARRRTLLASMALRGKLSFFACGSTVEDRSGTPGTDKSGFIPIIQRSASPALARMQGTFSKANPRTFHASWCAALA